MRLYVVAIMLTALSVFLGAVGWVVQAPIIFIVYFLYIFFSKIAFIKSFVVVVLPIVFIFLCAMIYQNYYAGIVIFISPILGCFSGYFCSRFRTRKYVKSSAFSLCGSFLVMLLNNTWISYLDMKSGISEQYLSLWNVVKINNTAGDIPKINSKYSIIQLWSIDCGNCKKHFPFWKEVKVCAEMSDDIGFYSLHLPGKQFADGYSIEAESILNLYGLDSEFNIYLNEYDRVDLEKLNLYGVPSYLFLQGENISFSQHTTKMYASFISSQDSMQSFFNKVDPLFVKCISKI